MIQGSQQWHEWRSSGIGASEIASVLGVSPYKSRRDLFLEKTGEKEPFKGNFATNRGSELEEEAAQAFSDRYNIELSYENTCITHPEYPFIKASIDRWVEGVAGKEALLEIKCPLEKNYYAFVDVVPEYYFAQVQQQLLVSGMEKAYFFVYHPELGNYFSSIKADKKYQENIVKEAKKFWMEIEKKEYNCDFDALIVDIVSKKESIESLKKDLVELESNLVCLLKEAGLKKTETSHGIKATIVRRKKPDISILNKLSDYISIKEELAYISKNKKEIEKEYMVDSSEYIRITTPKEVEDE